MKNILIVLISGFIGVGFQYLDTILGVTVDGEFIPLIIHHVIRYMGGMIICFVLLEVKG